MALRKSEGKLANGEGSKLGHEPPFAATMFSFRSIRNTQCPDGNYSELSDDGSSESVRGKPR